ncbi:hypothetical protein Naga_100063g8 [Nannochloropsis gaditana]|uniref:Uncharacterized protein n=1 Tax=Nannochloropsis gaditana TaxID=72520 RepID=W7TCV5_9STRA|nr:hypothetical protein Naga_100063g8 [Nannochloropsis gaditana]
MLMASQVQSWGKVLPAPTAPLFHAFDAMSLRSHFAYTPVYHVSRIKRLGPPLLRDGGCLTPGTRPFLPVPPQHCLLFLRFCGSILCPCYWRDICAGGCIHLGYLSARYLFLLPFLPLRGCTHVLGDKGEDSRLSTVCRLAERVNLKLDGVGYFLVVDQLDTYVSCYESGRISKYDR